MVLIFLTFIYYPWDSLKAKPEMAEATIEVWPSRICLRANILAPRISEPKQDKGRGKDEAREFRGWVYDQGNEFFRLQKGGGGGVKNLNRGEAIPDAS